MDVVLFDATPYETLQLVASDAVQGLDDVTFDGDLLVRDGKPARQLLLQVQTKDILFTVGGTDPSRATGVGFLLPVGSAYVVRDPYAIKTFKFTNAVEGQNGRIAFALGF